MLEKLDDRILLLVLSPYLFRRMQVRSKSLLELASGLLAVFVKGVCFDYVS
jgi:hypothetical protein